MSGATLLPGHAIGILGSGQLGRMLALAARRMGYRVHCYSPDHDSPTGPVADLAVCAAYDDLDAVRRFADGVGVATFEFENVPAQTVSAIADRTTVHPSADVLRVTQHRGREKGFLVRAGLPTAPFEEVASARQAQQAAERLGGAVVLKTATLGYDGKGQARVDRPGDAAAAWDAIGARAAIVEPFIDFEREVSVVVARGRDGEVRDYGPIDNVHRRHILDVSSVPSGTPPEVAAEARRVAAGVAESLGAVGVLCVEMFVTRDGWVLVNEIAPRVHNSGHLTIEASVTSQFEQHVRAICGLPLGSVRLLSPAAMANLLGDLWERGEPDWSAACRFPEVKLHLYGKADARPKRKMNHLTALAESAERARRFVLDARAALAAGLPPASTQ